eukprot:1161079-Pelagomonas_calceolata.AAC.1
MHIAYFGCWHSCHTHYGNQEVVAGAYHLESDSPNYVQPNGAGITKNIVGAELAAIAAAILQGHSQITTGMKRSINYNELQWGLTFSQ